MPGIHEKAPFLRLAPPFILGIVLAIHTRISPLYLLIAACSVFLLIVFYRQTIGRGETMLQRHRNGLLVNIFFFLAGMALVSAHNPQRNAQHIVHHKNYEFLVARVDAPPVEKEKSIKIEADILEGSKDKMMQACTGRVIFYLAKDSLASALHYGDVLLVKNSLKEISPPRNPFEFDYREYLHNHFIYLQGYLSSTDWIKAGFDPEWKHHHLFISVRNRLLEQMQRLGIGGQEYAVLSALVLGKTDEIDYHLMLSYSSSGAIHVLAVSGLHVGLIFIVLSWLLVPLKKWRGGNVVSSALAIILIWFYAGITGFSPSVLRATVMFTAMLCAGLFMRKPNIFNTLFFSAVGLLVWNPYYIMEVGFQLSYLAVLGIVVLYRKIYNWWFIHNWLGDKLWSLTAISIAAQAVTFPLGMLYFHQFPNLFLVSNLFVIPLSSLILYLSLLMFFFGWFDFASQLLARVVTFLTRLMNMAVQLVDNIPYSLWHGISITVAESYFIFGIVIFCCSWLMWKRPRHLLYTCCCLLLLMVSQTFETFHQTRHEEICIHAVRGGNAITYTAGNNTYFLHSGIDVNDESFVRFHFKNYWDYTGNEIMKIDLDSIHQFSDAHLRIHKPILALGQTSLLLAGSEHNRLNLAACPADIIVCTAGYNPKTAGDKGEKIILLDDDLRASKARWLGEKVQSTAPKLLNMEMGSVIVRGSSAQPFASVY